MVAPETRYGFWGFVALILLAGGATPRTIAFRCQRCEDIVWHTSDPKVRLAHRS